jgi:two-component system nitrogen regulation response regulator GlnG
MFNASGHILLPEFLPDPLRGGAKAARPAVDHNTSSANSIGDLPALIHSLLERGENNIYQKVIDAVERMLLTETLHHIRGQQTQASELLGLNRTTLRNKLRTLGLAVDKTVTEEDRRDVASGPKSIDD